ncbi:MAG: glycosyltransferase [Candidatus Nitrosopumilus sp. bin_68KS]
MTKKIRVAFIYKKSNEFLTGKHFDNTYYNFFMKALKRNEHLEVKYFPTSDTFDAKCLKDDCDVVLLWSNSNYGMPDEIFGIKELNKPVIARATDPVDTKNAIKHHSKWKIDYYFHFIPEELFYELYPKNFKFKTIIFGLEPSFYENVKPFNERIKNKILNSGAIGNTKFLSRMINDIQNPKWNAFRCYHLRTICAKLPFVDYTSTLEHEYVNDRYPLLLQKYAAAIAATTFSPNVKYWEIPAAGCLTFMEITEKNHGVYLGFEDGKNAIFINEKNYKEKFEEYLSDIENSKWSNIANNGRQYVLKNLNNDTAVNSLVDLMVSYL